MVQLRHLMGKWVNVVHWNNTFLEESVNVFLIVCLYELNLWMFSSLLIDMNGLCEYFFHRCWYEWNRWIFSLLFACMNGLFECFLNRCLFIWMEYVNFFFHYLLTWMDYVNVFTICLCKWKLWMLCLWFFHINVICECFLLRLFIYTESSDVLFAVYLYEWNLWMLSLLFA